MQLLLGLNALFNDCIASDYCRYGRYRAVCHRRLVWLHRRNTQGVRNDGAVQDSLVLISRHIAVAAHRFTLARLFQCQVIVAVQRAATGTCRVYPFIKVRVAHAMELAAHAREAGAAVVGGEAVIHAWLVHHGIEFRFHTRHGVDLTCQCWNEERIHDGRSGDLEADRTVDRRIQLIDRSDTLLRVNEQPFPVQRHDFHDHRLGAGRNRAVRVDTAQRTVWIEGVGADPGQQAQHDDDQQGRAPDDQLEASRVVPVRLIFGRGVVFTVAPCEEQGQGDYRNDNQQHQQCRYNNEIALLNSNVTGRIQYHCIATSQQSQG